jgi:hypothetical protein
MCLGFVNFKVEQDPIKLWSAESSTARQNKKYFDDNFGPFYRITQLIIVPKDKNTENLTYSYMDAKQNKSVEYSYALSADVLKETHNLYDRLNNLKAYCPSCNDGNGKLGTSN